MRMRTGTRWITLVKLPVALSGGSSAKRVPVAGLMDSTGALDSDAGVGVDFHAGYSAQLHILDLGFLQIGRDPQIGQRHDGQQGPACLHQLAGLHILGGDHAAGGGHDAGVGQSVGGQIARGAGCLDLGLGGGQRGTTARDLVAGGIDALFAGLYLRHGCAGGSLGGVQRLGRQHLLGNQVARALQVFLRLVGVGQGLL